MVYFYRNVLSHMPNSKVKKVTQMLKAIHAPENLSSARTEAADIADQLKQLRLGKAAFLVEGVIQETPSFHRLPNDHWVRIRTNNSMEHISREIRRRTRVVGAFPDGQSAVMLRAARLTHIA